MAEADEHSPVVVLCDLCWFAAGGREAVAARAAAGEPVVVLDPVVEDVLLACSSADSAWRHALDRVLIDSGIRWSLLRWIRPAARVRLAALVAARSAPAGTRRAVAPLEWLDCVDERIAAGWGSVFKYRPKARRWREIGAVWAEVAERERRPLTRISQEEIAAAVGCSTKTVQRVERWLQTEGLLWEVVPGCLVPQADVPEAETAAERAVRQARQAAADEVAARAAAAHQALVAAEMEALHAGLVGADAAEAALAALGPALVADLAAEPAEPEPVLLRIVPVYELRVPLSAAELAEEADLEAALGAAPTIPAPRSTSENTASTVATDEFVHPPQSLENEISSPPYEVVDNGRASRGSDNGSGRGWWPDQPECGVAGPGRAVDGPVARRERSQTADATGAAEETWDAAPHDPEVARAWLLRAETDPQLAESVDDTWVSAVLRTAGLFTGTPSTTPTRSERNTDVIAGWLLRSSLDPRLCDGVDERWLAKIIEASGLLAHPEWDAFELRDQLHGEPEYARLPYHIRDCRGWIKARLKAAVPQLPPHRRRAQQTEAEASEPDADTHTIAAAAARRRAAINACVLCDENGLLDLGGDAPLVRCNHDPHTGGW